MRGIEHWAAIVSPVGWALAAWSYYLFRRWVRYCRKARIAVAWKRRVVLEAPITDWVAWAQMLGKDEAARGRVVYRGGHVSVAIARPGRPRGAQAEVVKQT
jgi:hypothetical protein